MTGFLVSKNYKYELVTPADIRLGAIVIGYALGFCTLTCIKAAIATKRAIGRSRRANIYVVMIWGEIIVSLAFGLLGWLNLNQIIGPRCADQVHSFQRDDMLTLYSFWLYISMCGSTLLHDRLELIIIAKVHAGLFRFSSYCKSSSTECL